jgi:hypothetical protein
VSVAALTQVTQELQVQPPLLKAILQCCSEIYKIAVEFVYALTLEVIC